jgi:hypothetical protein
MKRNILIVVTSWFIVTNSAYGQESTYHSIQEALNHHIEQLKSNISHYDKIFIMTNLSDSMTLADRVFKIENGINAKFLQKSDENYLIEIRVATETSYLKIYVTNYRVIRLSTKKVKLINLSNGDNYLIK